MGHFMIRKFSKADLDEVMQIWLSANIDAHHFIPKSYWESNFEMVKGILPAAEVYVYENPDKNEPLGFIGLTDNYIAGLFVRRDVQSQGIGKELLDYAKEVKDHLSLSVYKQNTRAVCFYQREHFVIDADATDANTGEPELLLSWTR